MGSTQILNKNTAKKIIAGKKTKKTATVASPRASNWDELNIYQQYLKEVSRHPLLTRPEEKALLSLISKGNKKAMDRLVVSNLRFVINVAFMYKNQGLTVNELINEGNIGLMESARRFDPTKEIKFISYAVWWIRQGITRAIAEKGRLIRISAEKELSLRQLNRASGKLTQTIGGEFIVDTDSLEGATKYSGHKIADVLKMGKRHLSFDAPVNSEGEGGNLLDITASDSVLPNQETETTSSKKHIKKSIAKLKKQEQRVLSLYYGLDDNESINLKEIGQVIGLSKERVRQVKEHALAGLRKTDIREEVYIAA
jgi:RNA polymerase primary sigma factor